LELLIIKACQTAEFQPFGGHLTIFKFTTNWRVSLGTPYDDGQTRHFIDCAVEGKTLMEALKTFNEQYGIKTKGG